MITTVVQNIDFVSVVKLSTSGRHNAKLPARKAWHCSKLYALSVFFTFTAIGCGNIEQTMLGVERAGDTMILSCEHTQERWHLICKDNTWVGDFGNCSSGDVCINDERISLITDIDRW